MTHTNPLLDLEVVSSLQELDSLRSEGGFAREMYTIFANQSESITKDLVAAIATQNLNQVRHLAHRLRGTAANIGAIELSNRASSVENLVQVQSCDLGTMTQAVKDLIPLQQQSLVALREFLDRP